MMHVKKPLDYQPVIYTDIWTLRQRFGNWVLALLVIIIGTAILVTWTRQPVTGDVGDAVPQIKGETQ